MANEEHPTGRGTRIPMIGGLLSALGAAACCLPMIPLSLGLGGAWFSSLRAMEAYRPALAGLTIALLGYAFYRLYVGRWPGTRAACREWPSRRTQSLFWIISAVATLLVTLPWYAVPLFY